MIVKMNQRIDFIKRLKTKRLWKMVGELNKIYPIRRSSGNHTVLSIASVRLPNSDFTGCDEEEVAAALGYVAHLLCVLTRWFDVPLRYPLLPMFSRSVVKDDIRPHLSNRFPLYSKGVDRTRFDMGYFY